MNADRFQQWRRVGLAILLLVLTVGAATTHVHLLRGLSFDGENSLTEGETLAALWRYRQGQSLYHDFSKPPHALTQYMPLFYALPGTLARIAETDWNQTVFLGRLTAYVWWTLTGIVIAVAAWQRTGRAPAVIAMLFWWNCPFAIEWANSFRPDSAAVFFSLSALCWYGRTQGVAQVIGAGALVALACLHKQSAAAVPLVIFADLLRNKRYRHAALLVTTVGALVAAVAGAAQLLSAGAFTANVLQSVAIMGDWRWPFYMAGAVVIMGGAVWAGAFLAIHQGHRLWRDGLMVSGALALATSFKFGSWTNYYLETFAIGCVLTGLYIQREHRFRFLIWFVLALGLAGDTVRTRWTAAAQTPLPWSEMTGLMRDPVLAEDSYAAVRNGAVPYMVNPANFAKLQSQGLFDDTELLQRLEAGWFNTVLTIDPIEETNRSRPFPDHWLPVILQKYVLAHQWTSPDNRHTLYLYRQ
jgi:MFS family permease